MNTSVRRRHLHQGGGWNHTSQNVRSDLEVSVLICSLLSVLVISHVVLEVSRHSHLNFFRELTLFAARPHNTLSDGEISTSGVCAGQRPSAHLQEVRATSFSRAIYGPRCNAFCIVARFSIFIFQIVLHRWSTDQRTDHSFVPAF